MIFLRLFFEFFKIGLFAVGGGMATIPFLYSLSDATGWFSHNDLANMIAISESTPGPVGVNMATYVGFITTADQGIGMAILGAVTTTLGLITPSVIVILIVARILNRFRQNRQVEHAFYGLRPASTGLIAAAVLGVIVSNLFNVATLANGFSLAFFNWKGWILAAVLWTLTNLVKKTKKWHPIVWIGLSAVAGVLFSMG